MIHVFNFCGEVLSLPGKACLMCADLCGTIENVSCGPLKSCCDEGVKICNDTGNFFSAFMEQPLSTYVMVKVILGVSGLFSCVASLNEPSLGECHASIRPWLFGQVAFSVLHLLFAPHFQQQVFNEIVRQSKSIPVSAKGTVKVPPEQVHSSFKTVLLHDIPVCIYAFVLVASFAWSNMGSGLTRSAGCNPGGWPATAANLGLYFFWVSLVYVGCYYFCRCCASSVTFRVGAWEGGVVPEPSAPALQSFPTNGSALMSQQALTTAQPASVASAPIRRPQDPSEADCLNKVLAFACAYLVPPLGIYWRFGCGRRLGLCILLTMLGYVPGIIYAVVLIGCSKPGQRDVLAARAREPDLEGHSHYISIK